jgi:tRNA pseudouridine38-40 synthase
MMNIRMLLEYDGTDFFGWQYQPHKRTVQGDIETALNKITNETIRVIAAGRTDRGVHALGQVMNFFTTSTLNLQQMRTALNSLTANDIYVKNISQADDAFHSRYSAKSKVYYYHIIFEALPLKIRYNWYVDRTLDVSRMKKTIPYVVGTHDFSNFSAADGSDNKLCTIFTINLTEEHSGIIIHIEGNRFLRKMIRGIVGFLYDVGRGRFSPQDIKKVFSGSLQDIYFAPPQGLWLVEVRY